VATRFRQFPRVVEPNPPFKGRDRRQTRGLFVHRLSVIRTSRATSTKQTETPRTLSLSLYSRFERDYRVCITLRSPPTPFVPVRLFRYPVHRPTHEVVANIHSHSPGNKKKKRKQIKTRLRVCIYSIHRGNISDYKSTTIIRPIVLPSYRNFDVLSIR